MQSIIRQLAAEIKIGESQVRAAVDLLDGGATVPFIARYRKEATGGLDDIQLRELEARLSYLRELDERRAAVLKAIDEQGKLTDALRAAIAAAPTKQELEDLYLPFKQKRRTKGQIAREFGIEPLADKLFADPTLDPVAEAQAFCKPATLLDDGKPGPDFSTPLAVLDGVRDILSERWAEDPQLVQALREWLWAEGLLRSKKVESKNEADPEVAKFRDYFDYDEPIGRVPSHRALAVFRGRALEILEAKLVLPVEPEPGKPSLAEGKIALHLGWSHAGRKADDLIRKCVAWTWRVKLSLSTERDLFSRLREEAEKVAIKVFADNLRDLLLAAPAGTKAVMGLDPGIRTGVKVAVVDATGKLVETATIYPHEPRRDWDGSLHTLARLVEKHGVQLIAIGNGTASRETDKLAAELIKLWQKAAQGQAGQAQAAIEKIVVSEAGASVYSASEYASQDMPDVDRAAPAGPAGRAGQDRPQEHWRRPVPARREPERTGAHAGCGGRRLRQLRGRGPEHRQCAAALARIGPVAQRGQGRGALARAERRVQEPQAAHGRVGPGRQDLRAGRGLSAHPRWRQPAGHDRRAPRDLPGGGADHCPDRQARGRADGPRRHAQDAQARAVCQREVRHHHGQGHPGRAGKARPRPAPRLQGGAL
jgi:uncharacterized protein